MVEDLDAARAAQMDVTRLLARADADPEAAASLVQILYEDLRAMARRCLAAERPGHTLQPTALVHEAYLRLVVGHGARTWHDRNHFFASAAVAIRRILIEHARGRSRLKRGGDRRRVPLCVELGSIEAEDIEILAVDDALRRLSELDAVQARIVELRFFAGLTVEEVAAVTNVSPSTVARGWRFARAWLRSELDGVRARDRSGRRP